MKIYPFIDKNIVLPIAEKLQGSSILSHYRFLKSSEWWSREQLNEYRDAKLKELIRHVYKNVPYYTDLFDALKLKPKDIENYDDLVKLPILTKQNIRDNFDKIISLDADNRKSKLHSTGGSTGTPLKFKTDMNCWNSQWASAFRAWDSYNITFGEKIFTIGGNSVASINKIFTKKGLWERGILRNYKQPSSSLCDEDLMEIYKKYLRNRPKILRGYPSAIYAFAKFVQKKSLKTLSTSAILTTGEILLPEYRYIMQEVFKTTVYDGYGAGDGGIHSHECYMHTGLHVSEENCIIEICQEGKRVENEQTGHVITTDLHNYVFPFIRYDVGDMAYLKNELCSCGRKTKLIGQVMGRKGKLRYSKDGTPITPTMLPFMLYKDMDYHNENNIVEYNKIDKYRFEQDEKGDIKVKIKLKNEFIDKPYTTEHIKYNLEQYFPGSKIDILFTEISNTYSGSGKLDYVVSNFIG